MTKDKNQASGQDKNQPKPPQTEVEKHPDLDPNEPGIDDVERERRRTELQKRQG